jgi:hypothetical protein
MSLPEVRRDHQRLASLIPSNHWHAHQRATSQCPSTTIE